MNVKWVGVCVGVHVVVVMMVVLGGGVGLAVGHTSRGRRAERTYTSELSWIGVCMTVHVVRIEVCNQDALAGDLQGRELWDGQEDDVRISNELDIRDPGLLLLRIILVRPIAGRLATQAPLDSVLQPGVVCVFHVQHQHTHYPKLLADREMDGANCAHHRSAVRPVTESLEHACPGFKMAGGGGKQQCGQ